MRILQPADWSKPRGFSHGVAIDSPGRWIILAGQTGGDEKGDYQPDMAAQVAVALRRIMKVAGGGRSRSRAHRPPDLVSDEPERVRGRRRRYWCGLARDAGAKFPALDAALHRWPRRCPRQGRDRSHRVCPDRIGRKRQGQNSCSKFPPAGRRKPIWKRCRLAT